MVWISEGKSATGAAEIGWQPVSGSRSVQRSGFSQLKPELQDRRDEPGEKMEAAPGFEPGMRVLQTRALPLGDAASV